MSNSLRKEKVSFEDRGNSQTQNNQQKNNDVAAILESIQRRLNIEPSAVTGKTVAASGMVNVPNQGSAPSYQNNAQRNNTQNPKTHHNDIDMIDSNFDMNIDFNGSQTIKGSNQGQNLNKAYRAYQNTMKNTDENAQNSNDQFMNNKFNTSGYAHPQQKVQQLYTNNPQQNWQQNDQQSSETQSSSQGFDLNFDNDFMDDWGTEQSSNNSQYRSQDSSPSAQYLQQNAQQHQPAQHEEAFHGYNEFESESLEDASQDEENLDFDDLSDSEYEISDELLSDEEYKSSDLGSNGSSNLAGQIENIIRDAVNKQVARWCKENLARQINLKVLCTEVIEKAIEEQLRKEQQN